jgi:hypothetical protein
VVDDDRARSRRFTGLGMITLAISFTLWFFEAGLA